MSSYFKFKVVKVITKESLPNGFNYIIYINLLPGHKTLDMRLGEALRHRYLSSCGLSTPSSPGAAGRYRMGTLDAASGIDW